MDDQNVVAEAARAPEERSVSIGEVPVLLFVRGLALLSVMLGVVISLHWYIGARLIRDAMMPQPFAQLAWIALWTGFGSIFAGFIGGRVLPRGIARTFQWVGFLWMGAFGLLLTSVAASDLVLWLADTSYVVDASWQQARALVVLGVTAPAMAWGLYVARRPALKRLEVKVPGLHRDLDGLRIVQLSDVHIGETLDHSFAEHVAARVNALEPDVIAITGDMIDGSVAKLRDEVAPLGKLKAKHGVHYVTGNHEYYHGGASWEAEGRRLGFHVLHNEHRVVSRGEGQLVIGGVTDVEGARFSDQHAPRVDVAFAGAPAGAPRILLAHQPRFARRAAAEKVALMLSGHTHGGQMFPFMFFVRLQQPVIGGMHVIDGVPTYTSNGTGYWGPPLRIGPRGEITEITLRSTSNE